MALLRALHRWVGLALAVVVGAVALSGGLLLLRDPYYRAVYPAVGGPITGEQLERRGEVLSAIERRWNTEGVRTVRFPREGLNAYHVWIGDGTEAFVEPVTGEVIDRWHWSERLPAFLFELHAHLLVRPSGEVLNGIAALFVVFGALSGLALWWPARRRASLSAAVPRRLTAGSLALSHATVGAIALLPILLFVGTGALMVFYAPVAERMGALFDARPAELPTARVTPREAPRQGWPEILAALDATLPDGETTMFYPGAGGNARLMFRKRLAGEWHPNGRSYVLVDPYTAEVVQTIDARRQGVGTRLMHAVYPVHSAKVGGPLMALLSGATALSLLWLSVGGAWSFFSRRALADRATRTRAARANVAADLPPGTAA